VTGRHWPRSRRPVSRSRMRQASGTCTTPVCWPSLSADILAEPSADPSSPRDLAAQPTTEAAHPRPRPAAERASPHRAGKCVQPLVPPTGSRHQCGGSPARLCRGLAVQNSGLTQCTAFDQGSPRPPGRRRIAPSARRRATPPRYGAPNMDPRRPPIHRQAVTIYNWIQGEDQHVRGTRAP
jgi:hypothetical protein